MRLSPSDVRQQQFGEKLFRGFDKDEVDRFLDQIAEDYESVIKENALLKEQLTGYEERTRSAAELEKTLQDTLVTAQKLTEEMKTTARREADVLMREAQLAGEKSLEEARAEEGRILTEVRALKRTRRQLVEDLRAMLEHYQRQLAGEVAESAGDDGAR